ncbi:MAG: amidase [Rhizobiales bacterium]|nr:amidase [Hyphomicrobiales bacterium]
MTAELNTLGAGEIVRRIRNKQTTAVDVMSACLARVEAREEAVGAFIHLDKDKALAAAHAADEAPSDGLLHGVPFGIKDIIDTADFPTGWGSPIYHGYVPPRDASCVNLFKRQGAVAMGKTVTTEFAYYHPGKTANPHNLDYTPGGSSSGSAAAVADHMMPLAFASQTGGSIIRPAAFCGIFGYKPSHGCFDLDGVMGLAPSLDTLGLMAREVEDLVLGRAALCGARQTLDPAFEDKAPRIGLVRGPDWQNGSAEMRDVCERAMARLADQGAQAQELADPEIFSELVNCQKKIMAFEAARTRSYEYDQHPEQVSDPFTAYVEEGRAISWQAYEAALQTRNRAQRELEPLFADVDVVLTPSAPGEAPETLLATGDPLYNRIWTLLQVPCVSVPFGVGPRGLPLAVQLVARQWDDDRLLAAVDWAHQRLKEE